MQINRRRLNINNIRIGIVGNGYVGKATSFLKHDKYGEQAKNVEVLIYDKDPSKCSPSGTEFSHLNTCVLIFVCVPTPMNSDGSCDTSLVAGVIDKLKKEVNDVPIFVRSTVPVGFCDSHGVNFMPEFLTEKNWEHDVINSKDWVIGLFDNENTDTREKIRGFLALAHKNKLLKNSPSIHFTSNKNAELTKYARNCFLAAKVSFFNSLEKFCVEKGVPYDVARELICLDKRVGDSHTKVPGPDGKRGFGGTCFPKDLNSLIYQMLDVGVAPMILTAANNQNNIVDRPEKDWENSKGRAVSY